MSHHDESQEGRPPLDEASDVEPILTESERRAFERLGSTPPLPRGLEGRVVRVLRREGLLQPSWPLWLPPVRILGAAAALALTFALGIAVGQRTSPGHSGELASPRLVSPARTRPARSSAMPAPPVEPVIMTQFYMDGTDPFLHYSAADEHPKSPAVLVKTWEY